MPKYTVNYFEEEELDEYNPRYHRKSSKEKISRLRERIKELEAENAALREIVNEYQKKWP